MANEADTCRKYVTPQLLAAGWDTDPHSIAVVKAKSVDSSQPRQLQQRGSTPQWRLLEFAGSKMMAIELGFV